MKKILFAYSILIVFIALVCTSCMSEHDKTTYYTQSQFDYITYEALLEFGGEFKLGHYMQISETTDEDSTINITLDKKQSKEYEEVSIKAMTDLHGILQKQKLNAIKMPIDYWGGYDKYIGEEYDFSKNAGNYLGSAYTLALPEAKISVDASYLRQISLTLYSAKCYLYFVYAQKNDDFHKKKYVYYIDDKQTLEKLKNWLDSYLSQAELIADNEGD